MKNCKEIVIAATVIILICGIAIYIQNTKNNKKHIENQADYTQDLYIEDSEPAEFNKLTEQETESELSVPVEIKGDTIKEGNKPPVDNTPPKNNNNQGDTKPTEDTKPVDNTPPKNNNNQGDTKPTDKPTLPATNNNGMTQKEIDAAKKMSDDAGDLLDNWGSDNGKTQPSKPAETKPVTPSEPSKPVENKPAEPASNSNVWQGEDPFADQYQESEGSVHIKPGEGSGENHGNTIFK